MVDEKQLPDGTVGISRGGRGELGAADLDVEAQRATALR
jgi:hypothetical protein